MGCAPSKHPSVVPVNELGGRAGAEGEPEKFKILLVGAPRVGKSALFHRYLSNRYPPPDAARQKALQMARQKEQARQQRSSVSTANDVLMSYMANKVQIGMKFISASPRPLMLEIWDIPGNFSMGLMETYLDNMDGAVVVADARNPRTLMEIKFWTSQFEAYSAYRNEQIGLTPEVVRAKQLRAKQAMRGDDKINNMDDDSDEDEDEDDLLQVPRLPVVLMANKADVGDSSLTDGDDDGDDAYQMPESDVKASAQAHGVLDGHLVSARLDTGVDHAFASLLEHVVAARVQRQQLLRF